MHICICLSASESSKDQIKDLVRVFLSHKTVSQQIQLDAFTMYQYAHNMNDTKIKKT